MRNRYGINYSLNISWGDISFHAFHIAVFSGIVLSFHYDPSKPFESLQLISGLVPFGELLRRIHYFSSQIFLLSLIFHKLEYLGSNRPYSRTKWTKEVLIIFPLSFLLLFTGYILRGSKEGIFALNIARNLLSSIPLIGGVLNGIIFGNRIFIVFLNHAVTFTLPMFFLFYWHVRLIYPDYSRFLFVFAITLAASLLFYPSIGHPVDFPVDPVKGPWFFLGIQELVYLLPPFLGGIVYPLVLLISLSFYSRSRIWKMAFWILLGVYLILSIVAGFLRGEGWQISIWR